MIDHHTHLKEYDDLRRASLVFAALMKKPPCFTVRARLLLKIVRSKDAQCTAKQ